jgi:hypothetical protein
LVTKTSYKVAMSRYELFDRSALELWPVASRGHDLQLAEVRPLDVPVELYTEPGFADLIEGIRRARAADRPVILMMGAHPIKLGLSRFLCDLVRRHWLTHVAVNGAGVIHDFELAVLGGTSENVARWIQPGQFGLWRETGELNRVIQQAADRREGLAEGVGRWLCQENAPFAELSLAATAWRHGVPMTCHVSVGSDIIHAHASCQGAALGQTSYTDFLIFTAAIQKLEGGVYLNVGTAVTGPEVYLKALSMARNVARQSGRTIRRFTTAVFD